MEVIRVQTIVIYPNNLQLFNNYLWIPFEISFYQVECRRLQRPLVTASAYSLCHYFNNRIARNCTCLTVKSMSTTTNALCGHFGGKGKHFQSEPPPHSAENLAIPYIMTE
jgi:hypothetical protein